MDFTQINISGLNGIFPNHNFTDIKIVEWRPEKDSEAHKEEFITTDKYKTIDFPFHSKQLKTQSIYRRKYILSFLSKETQEIDLIKIAEKIQLKLFDNTFLNCICLELNSNKVAPILYEYTIKLYILEEDYFSIVNYLVKDTLLQTFTESQLYKLTFFSNKTISDEFTNFNNEYTIFTKIIPQYWASDIIEKSTNQSGIIYISNSIDFKICKLLFYLNEYESIIVKRYLPRCNAVLNKQIGNGLITSDENEITFDTSQNFEIGDYIIINNEIRQIIEIINNTEYIINEEFETDLQDENFYTCQIYAIERIFPEILDKGMVELYECKINMKYDLIDFDNYV